MSVEMKSLQDKRTEKVSKFSEWISRLGVYAIVIILVIFGYFISPNFLTLTNFMNIIDAVTLLGIVAVGFSFVTYSGHFADMSVPSIMAFSGMIAVNVLSYGIAVSIIAGLLAGLLIGLINAFVIGKLRANPIIWTLAVNFVMSGFMRWAYSGNQIYPDVKGGETNAGRIFESLSRAHVFGGIPFMVVVLVVMVVIGHFIYTKTKFGMQLKLVGSALEVAKMTGVNVSWTVGTAFMLSALSASIGGIFLASLSRIGAYYNGVGFDFNSVTAIVIGGMTLAGGRGSLIGVMGGVFTMGMMSNIMTLIGIDTFSQTIFTGIVFILIVGINAKSLRKLGRDYA